jgi:DNA-directed RNA polymerase subunit alpha
MLVDDLDLPTYVHSVLSRAGVERVSDLLGYSVKELMAVPGLGQKSLEEIRTRLVERGWSLRGDESVEEEGEELLGEAEAAADSGEAEPETALLGGED